MSSTLTVADKLHQRFHLLSEKAKGSNSSIDDELISAIISIHRDIELVLNINPDSVTDPEIIYRKIVTGLSIALFEPGDIQKIISKYVRGEMWGKWSEGERELFISENIKQQEEKVEEQIEKARDIDELDKALDQVTGHKTKDFEREIEERQLIKDILNSVSKVEILTGIVDNDPGSWRIYISGAVFEIAAGKMKTPKEFETMYLTNFGNFLPASLTAAPKGVIETPWRVFVKSLYNQAVKIAPEDSTAMIEIGVIIDILSGYKIAKNTDEWDKGSNLLLEHADYYLFASSKMTQLLQERNIKTDSGTIGKIMTRKGMKRPGNPAKRVKGRKVPVKAWWIKKEIFEGQDGTCPGDEDE